MELPTFLTLIKSVALTPSLFSMPYNNYFGFLQNFKLGSQISSYEKLLLYIFSEGYKRDIFDIIVSDIDLLFCMLYARTLLTVHSHFLKEAHPFNYCFCYALSADL